MSVAFDHRDPGTAEEEWDRAAPWRGAAPLDLDVERVVVLAAHPDDETLGAGGLIAAAAARGLPVDVVVATDGEGSHPDADIRSTRRRESVRAVDDTAPRATLSFLALPDGGLREHTADLRRHVQTLLAATDARSVLLAAPWWGDGHRDHRVLGEIARDFSSGAVRVVGYPVWFWHWGDPAHAAVTDWRVLALPEEIRQRKRRAVRRHETQTTADAGAAPILHEGMLAHFDRDVEVFIAAADASADDSATPAFFEDFHRRHDDPWGLDSRFYEKRKRDVLLACLPDPSAARGLEIGCANGVVTDVLRHRVEHLLAVDVSDTALAKAAERLGDDPGVELRRAHLPAEWPEGTFDLIVLSEVGYFWSQPDLAQAMDRIIDALPDGGTFVACHWRHPFSDAPLTGDRVHAHIAARSELHQIVRHVEDDFLLDVFRRTPRGDA